MATYNLVNTIPSASAIATGDTLILEGGYKKAVTLPAGKYRIYCRGSQGGGNGGLGMVVQGDLTLISNTLIYATTGTDLGYNGGGAGIYAGGGATDIRIAQDSLYARVLVGGGGGGAVIGVAAGDAGLINGESGTSAAYGTAGGGASRSAGGTAGSLNGGAGSFGTGGTYGGSRSEGAGGGGAGWYGGGSGGVGEHYSSVTQTTTYYPNPGGGGSSFAYSLDTASIVPSEYLLTSSYYLENVISFLYNQGGNGYITISVLEVTMTPDSTMNVSINMGETSIGLSWNAVTVGGIAATGYKIYRNNIYQATTTELTYTDTGLDMATLYIYKIQPYIGGKSYNKIVMASTLRAVQNITSETSLTLTELKEGDRLQCDYIANGKTLAMPRGKYQLECYGAGTEEGSQYTYGGYSKGTLPLFTTTNLYLKTGVSSYAGSGATDIRIEQDSLYARVIVAGGSGSIGYRSTSSTTHFSYYGGNGGGLTGSAGCRVVISSSYYGEAGEGGTQTSGGTRGTGSTTNGSQGIFGYGGSSGYDASQKGGDGWYGGGGGGYGYYGSGVFVRGGSGGGSGYVYTSDTASNYPSGCLLNASYYLEDASTEEGTGRSTNGDILVTVVKSPLILYNKIYLSGQSGYNQIVLSWNQGMVDSTTAVDGYRLYKNGTIIFSTTSALTYTDTEVAAGIDYVYTLVAYKDNSATDVNIFIQSAGRVYDLSTTSAPTVDNIVTGDTFNVPYTGSIKSLTLPKGRYKLECWGAKGGSKGVETEGTDVWYMIGGLGGYSVGTLSLASNTSCYVVTGGQGNIMDTSSGVTKNELLQATAGYNGGSEPGFEYSSKKYYARGGGGGGGSDVRLLSNSVYNRVITAGGGGGSAGGYRSSSTGEYNGGYGGGTTGGRGTSAYFLQGEDQGTQTAGGKNYDGVIYGHFGSGAAGIGISDMTKESGGAGGGWYGGCCGSNAGGGGGGSGYVYNSSTSSSAPSSYALTSDYYLTDSATYGGNTTFTAPGGALETGHSGDGYVRITALYVYDLYYITESNSSGGTVTPSGISEVREGDSLTYTFTPATGYEVKAVQVDGVNIGTPSSYTFSNVSASHTIYVSFGLLTYTITSTADSNGTITPLGTTTVEYGSAQSYTIVPNDGYKILKLIVDGNIVNRTETYTFTNIMANHTIAVYFTLATSQDEYNITTQNQRVQHVKINLLNFNYQVVEEISGVVTDASISVDANADIRRTCNISLVVQDSSFTVAPGSKIWMDKYVQIYVGIENTLSEELDVVWTNMGVYMINNPTLRYDATTNTLSFQGVDLMAKMTGLRNGNLPGLTHTITAGSNIRSTIISTITTYGGFTRYVVEENPIDVPTDIEISPGGTVYDILSQLRDITPSWEIFFDVNGIFHYQKIPTGEDEAVAIDDTIWNELLLSHEINTDFSNVKNVIEVLGRTHDTDYYGGTATYSSSTTTYSITVSSLSSLTDGITIGFIANNASDYPYLKVNSLVSKQIINEDNTNAIISDVGMYCVVQYDSTLDKFIYLGHLQAYGTASDNNPHSPFYVGGTVGSIRIVLSGGDYDNIYSDDLAEQRARYELYLRSNMSDSMTITCVPIFWADVNTLVTLTIPGESSPTKWLIKTISTDLSYSGTQTIQLMKYYPDYEASNITWVWSTDTNDLTRSITVTATSASTINWGDNTVSTVAAGSQTLTHTYSAAGSYDVTLKGDLYTSLTASNQSISEIDTTHGTLLSTLNLSYNSISSIDLSDNIDLTVLTIRNNYLNNLDVSNNSGLTHLLCDNNSISLLNLGNNINLYQLNCSNNRLSTLDITNTNMGWLNCSNNNLIELITGTKAGLSYLDCSHNNLSTMTRTSLPGLVTFDCSYNELTELDTAINTKLVTFNCGNNSLLTSLDLTSNIKLTTLTCNDTGLSSLELSANTLLTTLNCSNTSIVRLDVMGNNSLTTLTANSSALSLIVTQHSITTLTRQSNTKLITVTQTANGSIAYISGQTFTISPDEGYGIRTLVVNGSSITPVSTYTFGTLTADGTITATYAETYTTVATAGTGGTISPSGTVTTITGNTYTFTITPNTGYEILDVTVDGVDVGAVSTYTVSGGTNHVIEAYFNVLDMLCFTANTAGSTISTTIVGTLINIPTLEYSTDRNTWNTFTVGSTVVTLANAGDTVYLCGNNSSFSESMLNRVKFVMTGSISASGNIMSLLDKTCQSVTIPNDNCFNFLFQNCTSLTTSPSLPATTLTEACYDDMFFGCTNLTTLPELPATTLADYCYSSMFYECVGIKLSKTQDSEYTTAYRIPTSGTGTEGELSLAGMFDLTGGTFTGTPTINTTYYYAANTAPIMLDSNSDIILDSNNNLLGLEEE